MGTARKMAQRVRINIDELLDLLARCAVREWEVFYYYTVLGPRLGDIGGVALQNTIERARIEDCSHFEQLVSCISEMGGEFPLDFREFPRPLIDSQYPLSWEQPDERAILRALSEAEKCSLQAYLNIYHLTEGKDAHTNRLVSSLLEEEARHRRELLAFLPTGAGHSRRMGLVQCSPSALNYGISDLNLRTFKAGT